MTDKTDLARDRTDWAEDRTRLAQERTFSGWLRTGLSIIVVALGLKALFGDFEPKWVPRLVSAFLCGVAVAVFVSARNDTVRAIRRLDEHAVEARGRRRISLITAALSIAATAIGVILWYI